MANLTTIAKNAFLYSISSILLRAASIILFPIFSSYLAPQDYGILSITQGLVLVIVAVSSIQIPQAITRFASDRDSLNSIVDKNEFLGQILGTGIVTVVCSNIVWV